MSDLIQDLIAELRRGNYSDPAGKIAALAAAIKETEGDHTALIVSLLEAHQAALRMAGMDAAQHRDIPEISKALLPLIADREKEVRLKLARCSAGFIKTVRNQIIKELAVDSDDEVRAAAMKASNGISDFFELQSRLLSQDSDGDVRLAAAEALSKSKSPKVLPAFFAGVGRDEWCGVQEKCAEYIEEWLNRLNRYPEGITSPEITVLHRVEQELESLGKHRFPKLTAYVRENTKVQVDLELLRRYGVLLGEASEESTEAYNAEEPVKALMEKLTGGKPRPSILLGPSGAGKTAVVRQLAKELAKAENGGWHVLRVQPAELLIGTKYIGEWETRLATLLSAIKQPRRVILYFPDIHILPGVGRAENSNSNVADALVAPIQDGTIIVLGEATLERFEKGLSAAPTFRKLFDQILLPESAVDDTEDICAKVISASGADWPKERISFLVQAADQYLHQMARPGKAVNFVRQVLAKHGKEVPGARDILKVLSGSTGIPVDILDDQTPLKPAETRGFFESRVMGQPEAVNAVIDLVMLIKAGLCDPNKPLGVMLFVGPTGVGKTELARALAEYIFGSPTRLLRYDMSEYASHDGFERLIGGPKTPGLLTQAVYEQPFSVVLLDEIEKSHQNVFDLCLQIFDAGRLTDGKARTIDFRRTIVILTSNVGATAGVSSTLGFQAAGRSASPPQIDKDRTFRELSNVFRPEFLNRIDQIINFRPLSLEVAENIARREVTRVLERAGISRRKLTVDVDPAVVSALVKEGYSPHFGARPLKRAVERLVLLPVARAIATGRTPEMAMLRLSFEEKQMKVVVVPEEKAENPGIMVKRPTDDLRRLQDAAEGICERLAELKEQTKGLALRKSDLLGVTQTGDFHKRSDKGVVFDEIYKLDQFLNAQGALERNARGFRDRLNKPVSEIQLPEMSTRVSELSFLLEQLSWAANCKESKELGDCYFALTQLSAEGESIGAIQKLLSMYEGFARRRRLTLEIVAESASGKESVYLHLMGLGAYGLLKGESGLHNFIERKMLKNPRTNRTVQSDAREVVRVDTWPEATKPLTVRDVTIKRTTMGKSVFLDKPEIGLQIFHPASVTSLQVAAIGTKDTALEKLLPLLSAQVESRDETGARQEHLVRRYELGQRPKIKNYANGKISVRPDLIFKGEMETLLMVPGMESR